MSIFLQCDRCDFEVGLPLDLPGIYRYYDLGNGRMAPLETEEGWCYQCQTMRVLEVLPSRAFIDASNEDFKKSLAEVEASADASRQHLPYVDFMRKVVPSHEAWLAWLPSRTKPVCLTCGANKIASGQEWHWTTTPSSGTEPFDRVLLAFRHPECGGTLFYNDTGLYIDYIEQNAFLPFSPQGIALDGRDPQQSPAYRVAVQAGRWACITDGYDVYETEEDLKMASRPPHQNRISRLSLPHNEFSHYCASQHLTPRGPATVSEKLRYVVGPLTVGGLLGGFLGAASGGGIVAAIGAIAGSAIATWISPCSEFDEKRLARCFERAEADSVAWEKSDEQEVKQRRKNFAEHQKIARQRWQQYHKIRNLAFTGELTGIEFEVAVAGLYERNGYEVTLTKASGDFGVDLLASKGTVLLAIQVKRYSAKVGVRAVQEVASGARHYHATEALVITDSFFTEPAQELARSLQVQLIDKERLVNMWDKMGAGTAIPPFDIQRYEAIRHDIERELHRLNVAAGKRRARL